MNIAPPSWKKTPHPSVVLAGFVLLVFCTGTAEYLVAGVLPQVAADLDVSVAAAGQTVTAYALSSLSAMALRSCSVSGPTRHQRR